MDPSLIRNKGVTVLGHMLGTLLAQIEMAPSGPGVLSWAATQCLEAPGALEWL